MKVSVFLMFLWILTVSRGDTEVSCVFMETCILPCSFQVGPHVVIHWIHMKRLRVHSYYDNKDQLGDQDQIYRNRTSLFQDQISRGNASLQLTGVKFQDEGIYKCYTSTNNGNKDSVINLKVHAPVDKINNCTVSTPTNRRRAAWRKLCEEDFDPHLGNSVNVGGVIGGVVGAVLVASTVIIGVVLLYCKIKKGQQENSDQTTYNALNMKI